MTMKKILMFLVVSSLIIACDGVEGLTIKGDETYESLSKIISFKEKSLNALIYEYSAPLNSISGISLKNIPISYGQYRFSKKTGVLCNVQLFIPKERNRELIISRINQDKRFKSISGSDVFVFTRRMMWQSNEIDLLQTSVLHSDRSVLEIIYNREVCDF